MAVFSSYFKPYLRQPANYHRKICIAQLNNNFVHKKDKMQLLIFIPFYYSDSNLEILRQLCTDSFFTSIYTSFHSVFFKKCVQQKHSLGFSKGYEVMIVFSM
jgi:hypothetical protein